MVQSGLLTDLFKRMRALGFGKQPHFENNSIIIEMSEEEFKQVVLANMPQQQRDAVSIEFRDGKLRIIIRLW